MTIALKSTEQLYREDIFLALQEVLPWSDVWSEDAQYFRIGLLDFLKTDDPSLRYNIYQSPHNCVLGLKTSKRFPTFPRVSLHTRGPESYDVQRHRHVNAILCTRYNEYVAELNTQKVITDWDYGLDSSLIQKMLHQTKNDVSWDLRLESDFFGNKLRYWRDYLADPDNIGVLCKYSTLNYEKLRTIFGKIIHQSSSVESNYSAIRSLHSIRTYLLSEYPTYPDFTYVIAPVDYAALYGDPLWRFLLACEYGKAFLDPVVPDGALLHRLADILVDDAYSSIRLEVVVGQLYEHDPAVAGCLLAHMCMREGSLPKDRVSKLFQDYPRFTSVLQPHLPTLIEQYTMMETLFHDPSQFHTMLLSVAQTIFRNASIAALDLSNVPSI